MHFSKIVIASLLALASSVTSQVVVTVTNTVTIVTVTVTPLSTSTSTVIVTVSGKPPTTSKSTSTSTRTITVTATPPATTAAASCPLGEGGSCGLWNPAPNGCRSCGSGLTCRSIQWSSSRCEVIPRTVAIFTSTYWDGA
ncbi:hypothetical protein BKA61DRAFT_683839 [Leptodontidium sp. MPI-SDFR-AT-0119]|nr:hypothetical protein BKA61DRAFT_683839 [Leptodontidium sp. MPI-SDFR-AT-0119]